MEEVVYPPEKNRNLMETDMPTYITYGWLARISTSPTNSNLITGIQFLSSLATQSGSTWNLTSPIQVFDIDDDGQNMISKTFTQIGDNTNPITLTTYEGENVSISIAAGVALGYYAFQGITKLRAITLAFATSVEIPSYCFDGCTNLESVSTNLSITTLYAGTFRGCTNLATIPTISATTIPDDCFNGCSSLSFSLTNITNVGIRAFKNVSTINVGNGILPLGIQLGEECFMGAEITSSDGLQFTDPQLSINAFKNCTFPSSTSITITYTGTEFAIYSGCFEATNIVGINIETTNANTTSAMFNDNSFKNCTGLEYVLFDASISNYLGLNCFDGCSQLTTYGNSTNIIDLSATALADYAFYNCASIVNVLVSSSLKNIPQYCFYGCTAITQFYTSSTDTTTTPIDLSNITSVNNYAFYNCTVVIDAYLAGGYNTMGVGEGAFDLASSTTTTRGPNQVTTRRDVGMSFWTHDGLTYNRTLGTVFVANFQGTVLNTILPFVPGPTGADVEITKIEYITGSSITTVVIPYTITEIGYRAFSSCLNLTTVVFTGKSRLSILNDEAFKNTQFTSFMVPKSLTTIAQGALPSTLTELTLLDDNGYIIGQCSSITTLLLNTTFTQTSIFTGNTVFPNLTTVKTNGLNATLQSYFFNHPSVTYENTLASVSLNLTTVTAASVSTFIDNVLSASALPSATQTTSTSTIRTTASGETITVKSVDLATVNLNLKAQEAAFQNVVESASATQKASIMEAIIAKANTDALVNTDFSSTASTSLATTYAAVTKAVTLPRVNAAYPVDTLASINQSLLYMALDNGESQYFVDSSTSPVGYYYKVTRINETQLTFCKSTYQHSVAQTISSVEFDDTDLPYITSPALLLFANANFTFDLGSLKFFNMPPLAELPTGYTYTLNGDGSVTLSFNGVEVNSVVAAQSILPTFKDLSPLVYFTSCLLSGTRVQTPNGPVPIESVRVGDMVLNHKKEAVRVIEIGSGTHNVATARKLDTIYTIPQNQYGAKSAVYLTKGHRVLTKHGNLVLPEKLGFLPAHPSEYCDSEGNYTVYHLRLDDSESSIVVNGGCAVESWK